MKKPLKVALVCAGNISESPVAKIRNLAHHLGPVRSSALRVASRIANILRAGQPVESYGDLKASRIILISVPDPLLPETVAEMMASDVPWAGKTIVLSSSRMSCTELGLLANAGAHTGSLALVPGFEDRWFVLEGDRVVVGNVRPLLAYPGVRITTLVPPRRDSYEDALACVGVMLIPLLQQAVEYMNSAGVNKLEASSILERQFLRTARSYLRSGRRSTGLSEEA